MASRVVRSAVRATNLRSVSPAWVVPPLPLPTITKRPVSGAPYEDPRRTAQSIIESLPGNSLITKTAILSAGAGISIFGISNELLVINEETVVAFCLLSVFWAVGKYGGPMYSDWADGQINKMKGILNAAREDHTSAVKARIENVKQLGSVMDVTRQLFEVSKETVILEMKGYELEQKIALVREARAVLDSWVRYEGQVKHRQQLEVAEWVMAKVSKELENPKTLQQILQQSVADIETIVGTKTQ